MGAADSQSSTSSSVNTTTNTDSFNSTYNRVSNISNAGNISLNVPSVGDQSTTATPGTDFSGTIFLAVGGFLVVVVLWFFLRK